MKKCLYAVGYGHLDPVYMWEWTEGYQAARATFLSLLERTKETSNFKFTLTSAAILAQVEESEPQLFEQIRTAVKENRWFLAGGWWVEADCNMPHGESLIRQSLFGQQYFKTKFGKYAEVALLPDTFGHCASLPQILKKSGMHYFVFMRPDPSELHLPSNLFYWEGIDGTQIIAARIRSFVCEVSEEEIEELFRGEWFPTRSKLMFYGVGNHGGGPTKESIAKITHIQNRELNDREVNFADLNDFFRSVETELKEGQNLTKHVGELQHHARGCYSTVVNLKKLLQSSEHALLITERVGVISRLLAGPCVEKEWIDKAWKWILFCQFHDILPGTCTQRAVEDAEQQLAAVKMIAEEQREKCFQYLASIFPTNQQEGFPIHVFNPTGHPRREVVEITVDIREWRQLIPSLGTIWWKNLGLCLRDAQGNEVPVQTIAPTSWDANINRIRIAFPCKVEGFYISTYYLSPSSIYSSKDHHNAAEVVTLREDPLNLAIENNYIRCSVNKIEGTITQLIEKKSGIDAVWAPSPRFEVITDDGDTWAHEKNQFMQVEGTFKTEKVNILESGPLVVKLAIFQRYGNSRITRILKITSISPEIEEEVEISWNETEKMLKMREFFNVVSPITRYSIPYGHISRVNKGEEEPGGPWVDLRGTAYDLDGKQSPFGVTVITEGKYGYDVWARMRHYRWGKGKTSLGVTILRSPVYAFHEPKEIYPDVKYEYQNQGIHRFRFRLVPSSAVWKELRVPYLAEEFLEPLIVRAEHRHEGIKNITPIVSIEGDCWVTFKESSQKKDALILRIVELKGIDSEVKIRVYTDRTTIKLKPHEIVTIEYFKGVFSLVDLLERPLDT